MFLIYNNVTILQLLKQKKKFEFSPPVDAAVGLGGYVLAFTKKVTSFNSEGRREFDLF